jgi:hypothetical protein
MFGGEHRPISSACGGCANVDDHSLEQGSASRLLISIHLMVTRVTAGCDIAASDKRMMI